MPSAIHSSDSSSFSIFSLEFVETWFLDILDLIYISIIVTLFALYLLLSKKLVPTLNNSAFSPELFLNSTAA
jgi:hypothetical protein